MPGSLLGPSPGTGACQRAVGLPVGPRRGRRVAWRSLSLPVGDAKMTLEPAGSVKPYNVLPSGHPPEVQDSALSEGNSCPVRSPSVEWVWYVDCNRENWDEEEQERSNV